MAMGLLPFYTVSTPNASWMDRVTSIPLGLGALSFALILMYLPYRTIVEIGWRIRLIILKRLPLKA